MKFKTLSTAIVSSFILTACGGGGSSDKFNDSENNNITTSPFQQWSSFFIDFNLNTNNIEYYSDTQTLDNGKIYSKSEDTFSEIYVTQNGVYDQSSTNNQYGKYQGTVVTNNSSWVLSPYSSIGSNDLKLTTNFKILNISNQPIAQIVSPNEYWIAKNNLNDSYEYPEQLMSYLKQLNEQKFPTGSYCLQIISETNNQDYLSLYNDEYFDTEEQQNILKNQWIDYSKQQNNTNIKKYNFKDTTAYLEYFPEDNDNYGVASYKSKYYWANLIDSRTEYTFADEIKELEDISADATNEEKRLIQELINLRKNSCYLFNNIASKAITDDLIK